MSINTIFLKLLLIMFSFIMLNALSIDEEIEAIQKAPVEERFKLMNALKKRIVQMKEEKRMNTIEKLQDATEGEVFVDEENNVTQDDNRTDRVKQKLEAHTQKVIEHHVGHELEDQFNGDD